jgi:hypothetical protein
MTDPVLQNLVLNVEQSIDINAAIGDVFEGLGRRLSSENTTPDGEPMAMVLERWPGGRWFRDLGEGKGHLWGFVQVIKPPTLIELNGPTFMSYPAAGHLQFRLTPIPGGTRLAFRHQALGLIDEEHRKAVGPGWAYFLDRLKRACE